LLWTIAAILVVLWLLGIVSSYTLGGFIHILLVIAVVIIIINLIQGRRELKPVVATEQPSASPAACNLLPRVLVRRRKSAVAAPQRSASPGALGLGG
jgi:hypothetical protein